MGHKMRLALAILISCAALNSAGASSYSINSRELTKDDIRKSKQKERDERAFCHEARRSGPGIIKSLSRGKYQPEQIAHYSYFLRMGEQGCPKDIDLAIALMDHLLAGQPLISANPDWLGCLYPLLRIRGSESDLARAELIARYLWFRGRAYLLGSFAPRWSDAERIAFYSRDDVWAMLNDGPRGSVGSSDVRIDIWLDPKAARFDPVRALTVLEESTNSGHWSRAAAILSDGKLVPVDLPRAEALLWKAAAIDPLAVAPLLDFLEPRLEMASPTDRRVAINRLKSIVLRSVPGDLAVRERLVRLFLPDLKVADPDTQSSAAAVLTVLALAGSPSAGPPLLAWIDGVFQVPGEPRLSLATALLVSLVKAGVPTARDALDREFTRHGGLAEGGDWTADPARKSGKFSSYWTANDYPVRTLRQEREGVVTASAIFGPDGKVVYIEITSSADLSLAAAVRSTMQRRLRRIFPEYPGRYVKVKLPPIQFRIVSCDKSEPVTAAIEGMVQVDGTLPCSQTILIP